jgi:GDP-L-fucose synthase
MNTNSKIYVAGHRGMVGSAIVRNLEQKGFRNLLLRTSKELDLTDPAQVETFFKDERPERVFLAAAHVGGILANATHPADFYYINSMIQNNVIHFAQQYGVEKLLFLGSSCIYPKDCPQPMKEEHLLSGYLEPTNEAYALAKISGLKFCQYCNTQYGTKFISCMPTNLYGPNDNFNLETSHVLPALIRKFHEAHAQGKTSVELWGTGTPLREFMHVDDMADACVFLMENYEDQEHLNIGTGDEISIRGLAELIQGIIEFKGTLTFDETKPDGTPRKLLDVSKLHHFGWNHSISLEEGIRMTYNWYREHEANRI